MYTKRFTHSRLLINTSFDLTTWKTNLFDLFMWYADFVPFSYTPPYLMLLELGDVVKKSLLPIEMVSRMAENGHHGETFGTNHSKLCHLGPLLPKQSVEFKCDNSILVVTINKGSSKEPMVMHLLRCLWFFSAFFEINISVSHVPGVLN